MKNIFKTLYIHGLDSSPKKNKLNIIKKKSTDFSFHLDYRNEKNEHINENMSNNDIEHDHSEAAKSQATVKRLSLFDTVEQEVENLSNQQEERTEPVISESDKEIQNHDTDDSDKDPEAEVNAEESDLDEDFNQETEEELLDIPTFLRRQAN